MDIRTKIITYAFDRLHETSTIKSLILFFSSCFGYNPSESLTSNLVFIILGVIGIIGSTLPDNLKKQETKEDEKEEE